MVLLATRALPAPAGTARRLDRFSVALNVGALALLVVGAELLVANPALAAGLLAAAALGLAALVWRELPKAVPLIPLDLLRATSFRTSVIASACCFAGMTMGLLALPFYLQHGLGQDTLMTGLYMTPWPLMVAIVAPVAGRLADRTSTGWLCAAGGVCLAIGLAAASLWPLHGRPLPLVLFTTLCGLGFGLCQVPNNRTMFLSAPRDRSGAAGGMQATARLAGQTAGGVVMSLLFTMASVDAAPRVGLGIGAVLTMVAGLVSTLRVRPMAIGAPRV
jgi:DHA2 family multidrug resistance protein-like MFS transporter